MQRRAHSGQAILATFVLATGASCDHGSTAPTTRRPTLVIVSGNGQAGEVGTTLPNPLVVRLTDSLGVPAARVVVRFSPSLGGLQDSSVTDAAGIAAVRWTLGSFASTQQIIAWTTLRNGLYGWPSVTFSATARAGPPANVVGVTDSAVAAPGTLLDTLALRAIDRYGNPTPGAPVAWLVRSGGGSVRPLANQTDARGAARALWTIGPGHGENLLTVSIGSLSRELTATGSHELIASTLAVGPAHACALTAAGAAYCWGDNTTGQLGVGLSDTVAHKVPVSVAGGLTFTSLVAGSGHTCGLTNAGEVYCWGSNAGGQLGSPVLGQYPVPTRVAGVPTVTALAAGAHHTCGLTSNGTVYCWGDNAVGQVGDGSVRTTVSEVGRTPRPKPQPLDASGAFVAIAAGDFATCAISWTGTTWCWGGNSSRELSVEVPGSCLVPGGYWDYGDYDWPCTSTPVRAGFDHTLTSVTAGGFGLCGVTTQAELVCWGSSLREPQVVPGARVSKAWIVSNNVCGLEPTGVVSCWRLEAAFPTVRPFGDVPALVNLSTNAGNSCGVSQAAAGVVYCWGVNYRGQLGDGTTYRRNLPVRVNSPRDP